MAPFSSPCRMCKDRSDQPLGELFKEHGVMHSTCADDANIYGAVNSDCVSSCAAVIAVRSLRDWYILNGLLLNPSKSVVIVGGTGE